MTIRARYAPSPTGHVHIGNIRTAIFNWLFARHAGGEFLLRVEDTDRERSTPEAIQTQLDAMEWLGLDFDEEPFYQSTRQAAHLEAAERLLTKGLAYKADKGDTGQGEAVLFKMPGTDMAFHDEIKGDLQKSAENMKDFVIVRSNGTPVFHLANVMDDIEMKITHVIRGDDHIENTYRHIALYQALDAPVPKFAHLPMITNAQGKPYAKRDGDAFVSDFRDNEYLAEALFNYLALLGWSPGDDREVMTRDEMIHAFTFDRVQSSPAQMDLKKLQWMNGEYMRRLPLETRVEKCRATLKPEWIEAHSPAYISNVIELMSERIKFFSETPDLTVYFFTDDFEYDEKAVRKKIQKENTPAHLGLVKNKLADLDSFTPEAIEAALNQAAEELEVGAGKLNPLLRIAVSGSMAGPSLLEMLALLGREKVVARIETTLEKYS